MNPKEIGGTGGEQQEHVQRYYRPELVPSVFHGNSAHQIEKQKQIADKEEYSRSKQNIKQIGMGVGDVAEQPVIVGAGIEELVTVQSEAEPVGIVKGGEGVQIQVLPDAYGVVGEKQEHH